MASYQHSGYYVTVICEDEDQCLYILLPVSKSLHPASYSYLEEEGGYNENHGCRAVYISWEAVQTY